VVADGIDDEIDPLEDERDQARNFDVGAGAGPKIARPNAGSMLPAANLRGLPPPTPSSAPTTATPPASPTPATPAIGSVEDLEAKGATSHIAPPRIAAPSAFDQHLSADEAQRAKLDKGSGIDQFSQRHHILGPILRGLSVAGSIVAPEAMAMIPGTDLHHTLLRNQNNHAIATDLGEQKTEADTGEAQANTERATAQAEKDRADAAAAGQVKPKEESWKEYPQFTDVDGAPLKIEANSGQVMRADGKPRTGFKAAKVAAEKPDNAEQQFTDEYQRAHPGASIADAQKAFKKNETVTEPGNFMPLYDEKGHVTGAWDPKSGRVVKPPDATGGHAIADKAGAAATKEAQPYQQMVDNATEAHTLADMATKGNASADVDLVLSFFKMMKGAGGAGVRFTQQEQNMILGARSAGQGLVAIGQKVIGEGQPLTPEQRANMVAVMDMHAKAAQQHLDSMSGKDGPPEGATMIVPGADGRNHYTNSEGTVDLGVAP
jgi:hypothetical protein